MKTNESHKEDLELMQLVARRDIAAYRKLIGKYLNYSVRFAERMVGDYGAAEDIAQETALKIWNEAPRWQPKAKFSTWLYQILLNACIDYKRKKRPVSLPDADALYDESPGAAEMAMAKEQAATVKRALAKLPGRQRAALVLCYYEEMSNQKAAEIMEINIGTLQQLLFRARQNLKELLEESGL